MLDLETALNQREQIVSAIAISAESLSGRYRRRWKGLCDRIAYTSSVEQLVRDPESLAVFLAVARRCEEGQPSPVAIDDAVCEALAAMPTQKVSFIRQWQSMLYPLSVLGICGLILVVLGVLLVPAFEQMFSEFGLSLPIPTLLLLKISHAVRSASFLVVVFVLILGFLCYAGLFSGLLDWCSQFIRREHRSQYRRILPQPRRLAWADWAWHLSLLRNADYSLVEALDVASQSNAPRWLREGSRAWASRLKEGQKPFDGITHFRGQASHLLALALVQEDQQSGLLEDVAHLYRDRAQRQGSWWKHWLSPVTMIAVGVIVGFTVVALFMPLISLISGLS